MKPIPETHPAPNGSLTRRVRLPWMRGTDACDWSEDATNENGSYVNTCCICGADFLGHKRRVICRECCFTPCLDGEGHISHDFIAGKCARCGKPNTQRSDRP